MFDFDLPDVNAIRNDNIIIMFNNGLNVRDISIQCGVTVRHVIRTISNYQINNPQKSSEIIEAFKSGVSVDKLSEQFTCLRADINTLIRERCTNQQDKLQEDNYINRTRMRNEKILECRRSGKTLEEIGAEFGLTREGVRLIIKRIGSDNDSVIKNSTIKSSIKTTTECQCLNDKCGKIFISKPTSKSKYCSRKCWNVSRDTLTNNNQMFETMLKLRGDGDSFETIALKLGISTAENASLIYYRHRKKLISQDK